MTNEQIPGRVKHHSALLFKPAAFILHPKDADNRTVNTNMDDSPAH
jgi:hypothetical protein